MGRKTVQDLLFARFDRLEAKVDDIQTKTVPDLLVKVAELHLKNKLEVQAETKTHNRITRVFGGIALLISLVSMAAAFLR